LRISDYTRVWATLRRNLCKGNWIWAKSKSCFYKNIQYLRLYCILYWNSLSH